MTHYSIILRNETDGRGYIKLLCTGTGIGWSEIDSFTADISKVTCDKCLKYSLEEVKEFKLLEKESLERCIKENWGKHSDTDHIKLLKALEKKD